MERMWEKRNSGGDVGGVGRGVEETGDIRMVLGFS